MQDNKCVLADVCEDGTYPDTVTRTCKKCNEACLTCYSGNDKSCKKCNYEKGYTKKNENTGECLLLICSEKMYLNINKENELVECLPCHKSCKSCSGGEETDCNSCLKGLMTIITSTGILCEECPKGYITTEEGKCHGK